MVNAAMAQLVEHILGKDEVPGPNPGSSSRQPRSKRFGALVFYRSSRTKAGIFLHLGVVLSCYSRFEPCFRTRSEENPVRIPHADASSSLVSDKCGYLYQRQIPGYAPDVSLRLGHLRGKTILNRFLTLSGRFASRCATRSKRFGALVFYSPPRTKAGIFLHLGVVLSCYSRCGSVALGVCQST